MYSNINVVLFVVGEKSLNFIGEWKKKLAELINKKLPNSAQISRKKSNNLNIILMKSRQWKNFLI